MIQLIEKIQEKLKNMSIPFIQILLQILAVYHICFIISPLIFSLKFLKVHCRQNVAFFPNEHFSDHNSLLEFRAREILQCISLKYFFVYFKLAKVFSYNNSIIIKVSILMLIQFFYSNFLFVLTVSFIAEEKKMDWIDLLV